MSESDFPSDIFDELDQEISLDSLRTNKRLAVRYRRNDIKAVVKVRCMFFPKLIPVILYDISSRGASINSPQKLGKKSRITLYLLFNDGKRFNIDATIANSENSHRYGLKFNTCQNLLADHLLHTQTDLSFS